MPTQRTTLSTLRATRSGVSAPSPNIVSQKRPIGVRVSVGTQHNILIINRKMTLAPRRGVPCPSNINGLVKSGSVKRLTRSRRIMHRVTHLAAKESGAGRTPHLGAQRPPLNHLAASPDDALRNWCRETDRTLTRASAHGPGPTLPVGCAKFALEDFADRAAR